MKIKKVVIMHGGQPFRMDLLVPLSPESVDEVLKSTYEEIERIHNRMREYEESLRTRDAKQGG